MRKALTVLAITLLMVLATVSVAQAALSRYHRVSPRYVYHGMESPDFYPTDIENVVEMQEKKPKSETYGVAIQMNTGNAFSSIDHSAKRQKYALILQNAIEFRKQHLGTVRYSKRLSAWIEKYSNLTPSQKVDANAEEAEMSAEDQAAMEAMEDEAVAEMSE